MNSSQLSTSKISSDFFVSKDGKYTGINLNALAKLSGLDSTENLVAIPEFGGVLDPNKSVNALQVVEEVRPYVDSIFLGKSDIVEGKAAAAILYFIAFSDKYANSVAKDTVDAFASVGIDNWIKSMVGIGTPQLPPTNQSEAEYATATEVQQMRDMIREVLNNQNQMQRDLNRLNKVTTIYPAFKDIAEALSEGNQKLLPSRTITSGNKRKRTKELDTYTLQEFLEVMGVELTKPEMHQFALLASQAYTVLHKSKPDKQFRYENSKSKGKYAVYRASDFGLLKTSLQEIIGGDLNAS